MRFPKDQVQKNLKAFINRGMSIAKAKNIEWNSDFWRVGRDVDDLISGGSGIHFRSLPSSRKKKDGVPFEDPFNSFAKAFIAILIQNKDYALSSIDYILRVLRYLYAVEPDPRLLTDTSFQSALDLMFARENCVGDARASVASKLELIADVMEGYQLSIEPISWKREIAFSARDRKPDDPEDQSRHNSKLPDDDVIAAVVDLYHDIPKTEGGDRLLICLCVLLLITGFRIREALSLPWDCLESYMRDRADGKGPLLDEEGMPVVYSKIRQYLPEKKGEMVTARRYLGRIGSQILRAVYEEIQGITQPFHDIAVWMAKNQGRAMLPFAPQKKFFTRDEVDGLFNKSELVKFLRRNQLNPEIRAGWSEPMFLRSELERVVLSASRIGIVRSKPWRISTSEILFIVGDMTFCRRLSNGLRSNLGIPYAVRPLGKSTFGNFLMGSHSLASVFERYGKKDAQGNPLRITSHQFRHWLNNEMYLGGMSEVQISYQFGRYNKQSNSAYDHRDPIERAKALRDAARKGEILGGFGAALRRMKVVDREEWIKSAYGNVHWGPLGGCADETIRRADAMPKECANCGGLIVVKGDAEGREEALRQLEFVDWWLAKAEEDAQDGDLDDDLQVRYYRHKATSLRRIIATHDDPSIRDGTHVLMDFISGSAELLDGACHV